MTLRRRPGLMTPRCESTRYTIGTTVRSGGGDSLLELANDAASGHPGQRITIGPNLGGVFHAFYWPGTPARYLKLDAYVSVVPPYVAPNSVTFALGITDGFVAVALPSNLIPLGFRNTVPNPEPHYPADFSWRFGGMGHVQGYLDVVALVAAGLSVIVPWRLTFTVVCNGASVMCEGIQLEEVSRFAVDDTDTFGTLPGTILPRAAIRDSDQMDRIGASLEYAAAEVRCTYLSRSIDETAGAWLAAVGAGWTSMTNDEELAGTALRWRVRPRRLLAAAQDGARFKWIVRYAATDVSAVRINTGGSLSPYTIALPATAGVWTDSAVGDGYLSTLAATDAMWLEGQTADQCFIDAVSVWKY